MSETISIVESDLPKLTIIHYKNGGYEIKNRLDNVEICEVMDSLNGKPVEEAFKALRSFKKTFVEKNMDEIHYYFDNGTRIKISLKEINDAL